MPSGTKKRPAAKPAGLSIATCQFPVEADISSNKSYVLRQMRKAARMGARVVHFSECALSGYAGVEFDSLGFIEIRDARHNAVGQRIKGLGVIGLHSSANWQS